MAPTDPAAAGEPVAPDATAPAAASGARADGGVVVEFAPAVNGKRAVIGFGITGLIAFIANYLGDTNGHHAARGTYLGVVFVIVGLSITWWLARAGATR